MDDQELFARLRAVADHLDGTTTRSKGNGGRDRVPLGGPGREQRGVLAAAVIALLVVAAALAGALARPDRSPRVTSRPGDPATTSSTSTTSTTTGGPDDTTATTTLQIEPARLVLATSYDALPEWGVLVYDGFDQRLLLGPDGAVIERPSGAVLPDNPEPSPVEPTGSGSAIRWRSAASGSSPAGCAQPPGLGAVGVTDDGGVSVAVCGTPTPTELWRVDGAEPVVLAGPPPDVAVAPGERVPGLWRDARPSPDGRWIVAQWSGECESPSAWFVSAAGGELRSVVPAIEAGDGEPRVPETRHQGWTPDGRAIVDVGVGICGTGGLVPGIHLIDPDSGADTLLYAWPADSSYSAVSWSKPQQ